MPPAFLLGRVALVVWVSRRMRGQDTYATSRMELWLRTLKWSSRAVGQFTWSCRCERESERPDQ